MRSPTGCWRRWHGSCVEVGGHVDKLTGDGIMAVFGAPTAHEDDAERAVRAAVNMQREVRQLVSEELGGGRQLGLRVGLNTGEVLAGVQAALRTRSSATRSTPRPGFPTRPPSDRSSPAATPPWPR